MPWPQSVKDAFEAAAGAAGSHDNRYPGAYNKLLHTLFPPESEYIVSPNSPSTRDTSDDGGTVALFEVTNIEKDVGLVLQVRPPWHLDIKSKREAADRQLSQRLLDAEDYPCTVYGVSAMGTKLCFYTYKADPGL